jgi:hemolysin III
MRRGERTPVKAEFAEFTPQQERIHALVHFLGIFFGLIGVPLLIFSALNKDTYSLIGISVYGICYLMVFTFSTLYHSSTDTKVKRLYKKLDRISIYFLIAGTYTPLVKFYIFNDAGISLLKMIWAMVVLGIYFEIQYPDRFRVISVLFYLFMGLLFFFVPVDLLGAMPNEIATLVIAGVILYVIGVFFYVYHKWKYHHAVWHTFVLSASICHYLAVLYTL